LRVNRPQRHATVPSAHAVADRVFNALERFLQVEAVSGIVLLACAAIALLWANSPIADSYHHFWHAPLTIAFGELSVTRSLHFVINDGLMTIFFLVVGMEIRREIHEGALADIRVAALPLAAALGGVVAPALIFLALNSEPLVRRGWAIPTATDIAFAVGVLALLGKSIPGSIRIFLLALAIIDDIAAVIIIAAFYSGGLDYSGLVVAGIGVLIVFGFQAIGISNAFVYVIPGAILWLGLLTTGAHPTLAGVVLGLITPVVARPLRETPLELASRAIATLRQRLEHAPPDPHELCEPLRGLRDAQRELLPPVTRVQLALHTWVAYLIMPLFALANAGVNLSDVSVSEGATASVMIGVALALVIGKPIGIFSGSWIAVRLGWCQLPLGVSWLAVLLVGCLGGIGFTMSIFIATLAFADARLLAAAKLGVLLASLSAGIASLALGRYYATRQVRVQASAPISVERSTH
jgi:NhaA family Na+:H+ antiporter